MITEFIVGILSAGLMLSIPYMIAGLGEMFVQRSGIFNLGVEGIMMVGAFTGFFIELKTGSSFGGFLGAMLAGALLGGLFALLSVTLRVIQGIAGIGLFMFGWGVSSTLFRVYVGGVTTIPGLNAFKIPVLGDIPVLGPIFFHHNIVVYLGFLLVPLCWYLLEKTAWGLKVRAIGTTPRAADTLGVNVERTRYQCVILGGILAGLGGAYLSICQAQIYADNLTAGRGFIAVALVIFGKWKPVGVMWGALLFSLAHALQRSIQVYGFDFPYELAVITPYLLVIVVLAFSFRSKFMGPTELGIPYDRESRI